jgi:hypothetical protein
VHCPHTGASGVSEVTEIAVARAQELQTQDGEGDDDHAANEEEEELPRGLAGGCDPYRWTFCLPVVGRSHASACSGKG